jgi:hypothetical protein
MNKIFKTLSTVLMIAAIGLLGACKKNFDNPPGPADPQMVANISIKDLKALHTGSGAYTIVTSDLVISGVVVADDKSGNLYKQIFIQDETGGLQILLDAVSLYNTYPVGRRVFIKCKDLCLSDYNNLMALGVKATVAGLPSQEGIPSAMIGKHVFGGSLNNPVVPKVVTFSDLVIPTQASQKPWLQQYLGMLITIDGFAFIDQGKTYSDTSAFKSTQNRDIKDCTTSPSQVITVRTSAYANFAGVTLPNGRGKMTAVFTAFGSTKQFLLRDTSDVKYTNSILCPGVVFQEDFETVTNNNTIVLPGWKNIGETGGISYIGAVFGSTPAVKCAKVTAFGTGVSSVTSWMITPPISLAGTTAPKLTYEEAAGFAFGATTLQVMISTNYAGGNNPSASTWTTLRTVTALTPTTGYASLASIGNLNLSAYIGQTVYIAFKYDGSDPSRTTTYEIDNVKVLAN